jgi:hypothetical protein
MTGGSESCEAPELLSSCSGSFRDDVVTGERETGDPGDGLNRRVRGQERDDQNHVRLLNFCPLVQDHFVMMLFLES